MGQPVIQQKTGLLTTGAARGGQKKSNKAVVRTSASIATRPRFDFKLSPASTLPWDSAWEKSAIGKVDEDARVSPSEPGRAGNSALRFPVECLRVYGFCASTNRSARLRHLHGSMLGPSADKVRREIKHREYQILQLTTLAPSATSTARAAEENFTMIKMDRWCIETIRGELPLALFSPPISSRGSYIKQIRLLACLFLNAPARLLRGTSSPNPARRFGKRNLPHRP